MIPVEQRVAVRSTLDGEKREMGLDTSAMAHILSVLTNLYADPIAAVVREYSTNGYDAVRDAGSVEPIRVTLPTDLHPHFTVQDFGIGMSTDTILDHYSLYGRSDKRGSNDVVGMLGLGCKSALTYANTFTITSVRNGVKTVAIASKGANGVGQIEIADTVSTTERNGTMISVPVKAYDVRKFVEAADTFYGYWTPGTVLVDGKMPALSYKDWTQVPGTQVWYTSSNRYSAEAVVVMGNVPYRVKSDILSDFSGGALVIVAEIGDVSFAPSREELMYDDKTNSFLRSQVKTARQSIQDNIDNLLANAASPAEAYRIRTDNAAFSFLSNVKWEYNGESIPNNLSIYNCISWQNYSWNQGTSFNKAASRFFSHWSSGAETIFIKNYSAGSLPANIKRYFWQESKKSDSPYYNCNYFVFQSGDGSKWADSLDWDDIKGDIPKASSGTSSNGVRVISKNSGKILDAHGGFTGKRADTLPNAKFVIYTPDKREQIHSNTIAAGFTPVLVYKRDVEAFKATYSTYTHADIDAHVKAIQASRDDNWYLCYARDQYYSWMKGQNFLDPAIAAVVQLTYDPKNTAFIENNKFHAARPKIEKILKPYNIVNNIYGSVTNAERVEAINALYSYRNGATKNV